MTALSAKRKKGFTLVELIVVIAILAILAAIAIPSYASLRDRAAQGVAISGATDVANAINIYNAYTTGTKITTAGWTTKASMAAALGTLAPVFKDDASAAAAVARVTFTSGIAVVNVTIT